MSLLVVVWNWPFLQWPIIDFSSEILVCSDNVSILLFETFQFDTWRAALISSNVKNNNCNVKYHTTGDIAPYGRGSEDKTWLLCRPWSGSRAAPSRWPAASPSPSTAPPATTSSSSCSASSTGTTGSRTTRPRWPWPRSTRSANFSLLCRKVAVGLQESHDRFFTIVRHFWPLCTKLL